MKLEVSPKIFGKYWNIEFHENPSSGIRVVPCGRTDGQTDMTKLIVAFCNFSNAPKNMFKTATPYRTLWTAFFNQFFLLLPAHFTTRDVRNNAQVKLYISLHVEG
jgi:hypothetical protein